MSCLTVTRQSRHRRDESPKRRRQHARRTVGARTTKCVLTVAHAEAASLFFSITNIYQIIKKKCVPVRSAINGQQSSLWLNKARRNIVVDSTVQHGASANKIMFIVCLIETGNNVFMYRKKIWHREVGTQSKLPTAGK